MRHHPSFPLLDPSLLHELAPFSLIARNDLRAILAEASPRRHERGTEIFSEGETATSFFLLLDGYVRVRRITAEGEQIIMRYVPAGQLIGIAAAIGKTQYPATAEAASECLTLVWPMPLLTRFMADYPGFAHETNKAVGIRLAEAHDRVVEQTTQNVERRIANALLRLIEQGGRPSPDGIEIGFAVSRGDLAEYSGTTLFTISRTMRAWEKEGLVRSNRKRITICDTERLSGFARPLNAD
ncbi:MAG: Crp/Fnr family transcriptional regulator [Pseudomonadota bacterium]